MACVNEHGKLTESAKKLLSSIEHTALTPESIAASTNLPLFKVRSSLRDMKSMDFVIQDKNTFLMNPKVKKLF